ncbi:spore cortex biosynthesis protein YabQ [Neobacillus sp. PS3-40]|uniref:spore cortex biosynthesis protein YabQ n=1 Tax=Neobacillus sp. PS3-40 TaxID=3070679 RepID=UPI0027E068A4|nr:spore cortex biosynthesis protein YabQ [Neobacillus sp. PS3-40]WML42529.1 spore cortex biosynthesis protein YabQ [Neobacillus sp. PS3-40]
MTLSTQFLTMLSMIGMGALFGVMFDTYQRFLHRPKRRQLLVFFNDILFWVIQALIIFYVLFQVNMGEVRLYIFIALLCGYAAYQSLFKRIYLRLLEIFIFAVISILTFLKNAFIIIIYKPVRGLFNLIIYITLFLGRGLFTLVKFIFKVLLLCIKMFFKPIGKILLLFWKLLPKGIKKTVEKFYNGAAGNFKRIKNYVTKWIRKWKK